MLAVSCSCCGAAISSLANDVVEGEHSTSSFGLAAYKRTLNLRRPGCAEYMGIGIFMVSRMVGVLQHCSITFNWQGVVTLREELWLAVAVLVPGMHAAVIFSVRVPQGTNLFWSATPCWNTA